MTSFMEFMSCALTFIWVDLFRVVVQNERYEEWRPTLIQLKRLFIEYPERVMSYHQKPGLKVPTGWNSTASQGNFLEVLNMALNGKSL